MRACLQCNRPMPGAEEGIRFCSPPCAVRYGRAHPRVMLGELSSQVGPCKCPGCQALVQPLGEDNVAEYVFKTTHLPREEVFRQGSSPYPGPFEVKDMGPPPFGDHRIHEAVSQVMDLVSDIRMSRENRYLHISPTAWSLVESQLELHPGFNHTPHGVIQIMTPGWVNVVINPALDSDPLNLGHPTVWRWHFSQHWECKGPECH